MTHSKHGKQPKRFRNLQYRSDLTQDQLYKVNEIKRKTERHQARQAKNELIELTETVPTT